MRLVAHFPQQMLRNALYQYTICTVPQNKFPANAKFAEFRNNQNLCIETLLSTLEKSRFFKQFPGLKWELQQHSYFFYGIL